MSTIRRGKRDVTLTTLIDLLVQVVFVFTLLLIASGAIEGAPEERGYVAAEVWKTLVSIFDVDPKKSAEQQMEQIRDQFRTAVRQRDEAKRERDEAKRQREALQKTLSEMDLLAAQLKAKLGGAPGLPPCRANDGRELAVLAFNIDIEGMLTSTPLESARAVIPGEPSSTDAVRRVKRADFQRVFSAWRELGRSREPQCRYVATVNYEPRAPAGEYQPSQAAISSVFYIKSIARQRGE